MGVDYSAGSGYGFGIPFEECEELATRLEFPQGEWGFDWYDFGQWLVQDFDKLGYDTVGNFMSGEDMYLVIAVAASAMSLSMYEYDSGFRQFAGVGVEPDAEKQLVELFALVHERLPIPGDIGWYVSTTVS